MFIVRKGIDLNTYPEAWKKSFKSNREHKLFENIPCARCLMRLCVCVFSDLILTAQKSPQVSSLSWAQMNIINILKMVSQWVSGEAGFLHSQTSLLFRLYSAEFLWTTNGKIEN